jgi:hypothetical protein
VRIFPRTAVQSWKIRTELEKFTEQKLNLGKILQGFSFKSLLLDVSEARACKAWQENL